MKNLVLIFDDLWQCIDLVKVGCCVSVVCCRLIIPTRSLEVCRQMLCKKVVKVEKLCDDEAWKLFIETLMSGDEIGLGHDVEEIAKSVARLCEGLPLGIINVAGNMRGKTSIRFWNTALSELTEPVTRQGGNWDVEVLRVLKYSFDRLNNQSQCTRLNSFQRCFLYCSLSPQNCVGERSEVAEKFISEGLVDGRNSRRAQIHQGHSILDKLVDVCLLEDIVGYDGYVKMHYLVRRMALKIGEQNYMTRAGVRSLKEIPIEKEWTMGLEKVSFMSTGLWIIRDGISPFCPNLTTLLLNETPLCSISNSFFSKMKRLTAINLSGTNIKVLPDSICNLTSLESLLLDHCYQLKIVPYLGKLKALRELNLSYTDIEEVPQGVEELFSLQFLTMDTATLKELPSGLLLELGHLQCLKFPIRVEIPSDELWDLKEVEELHGRLNSVRVFNDFVTRNPDALYQVQVGQYYTEDEEHTVGGSHREAYLSQCNLRYEKVFGGNIQSLAFWDCEGMSSCLLDEFSPSNHPKSLKILRILECKGTAYIWRSSQESPFPFSTLEHLQLEALKDFKGLDPQGKVGASAVFSSLKSLRIKNCCSMKSVGLPVTGFPSLEDMHISECGEVEKIFEDEGRGLVILPKLKELELCDLPCLQSLCKATVLCNTIRTIYIRGCPSLMKKLPLHVEITQVREAINVVREWWESLEWEDPSLPQLLQPLVHFF